LILAGGEKFEKLANLKNSLYFQPQIQPKPQPQPQFYLCLHYIIFEFLHFEFSLNYCQMSIRIFFSFFLFSCSHRDHSSINCSLNISSFQHLLVFLLTLYEFYTWALVHVLHVFHVFLGFSMNFQWIFNEFSLRFFDEFSFSFF